MKKQLFIIFFLLFTSCAYGQYWQTGTNLGSTDADTYCIWNSVSGNCVQLNPNTGFLLGDLPNNNFFRANTDCSCAEIKTNTGFSLYFMPALTRNTQWTPQSKDITVAGLDDIPTMVTKTASGSLGVLSYVFTVPSGFTMSLAQSQDKSQAVVAGSSVSGTTLTIDLSFVVPGTSNLIFTVFLK